MNAIAISYQGENNTGFNYGFWETGFQMYYDSINGYQQGHYFTCMEVKFTGRILDNDTVPVFDYDPMVFVDVKLNLPTDVECKFVR